MELVNTKAPGAARSETLGMGGGLDLREEYRVTEYKMQLYISGRTQQSQLAIDNLMQICETELRGLYEVEVIDVLERPDLAAAEKILATPTLVKRSPLPSRKIIGNLSDRQKVLLGLDVEPAGGGQRLERFRPGGARRTPVGEADASRATA